MFWSNYRYTYFHVSIFILKFFLPVVFSLSSAIGVGAIQANIAVFGAEQVKDLNKRSQYFDKYVVAVNIGGILATLLVSYIQGFQSDTRQYESFHGYLFAASSLVGAFLLFIVGKKFYIHIAPHDTIITKCIPVIINAFQTRRKHKDNEHKDDEHITPRFTRSTSSTSVLLESNRGHQLMTTNEKLPSFLDYARVANNGKFNDRIVNDVKSLRRVIIVFLLLMPYWLIYYQVRTI